MCVRANGGRPGARATAEPERGQPDALGLPEQARAASMEGVKIGRRLGHPFNMVWAALGMIGRVEDGLRLMRETLRAIEHTGHRTWKAVTHRVLGELLLKAEDRGVDRLREPEDAFKQALRLARASGAKGCELLTETSLPGVWQSSARRKQAYGLLAPIYDSFDKGFDTRDLMGASELLAALRQDCTDTRGRANPRSGPLRSFQRVTCPPPPRNPAPEHCLAGCNRQCSKSAIARNTWRCCSHTC